MVEAGKKAQITRLKNEGRDDEARKLEEKYSEQTEKPKEVQKLRAVKVRYDVPVVQTDLKTWQPIPWVEKYRPVGLRSLVGDVAPYLRAFIKTNSFPLAMVFYGDFGQGKTAGAKCFVRDYFVNQGVFKPTATFKDVMNGTQWTTDYEGCWSPVLYVDSTLDSNVECVKDKVLTFMRVRSVWNEAGLRLKKFALFDEADRLGYAAQGALRSLLEKYPGTVTIYTTNKIESVDPAIVSRAAGGVFEFKKPSKDELVQYLKGLLKEERISLSQTTVEEIAIASQSVREAVGKLQQEVALESV